MKMQLPPKLPLLEPKYSHNAFLTALAPETDIKGSIRSSRKSQPSCAAFSLNHDTDSGKQRTVYYVEHSKRHAIDFNSPHAADAAAQLGLTFEDCVKKSREEFMVPGVDKRICKLKYEHHCRRVYESLKALYNLRKELISRAIKKTKRCESNNSSKIKLESVPSLFASVFPSRFSHYIKIISRKGRVWRTMGPLAELRGRSHSEERDKSERRIGPAEKKDMKDFIELTWREMLMLENAEKMKKRRLLQTDGFRTSRASSLIKDIPAKKSPKKLFPAEWKDPYDIYTQVRKRIEEQKKLRERLKTEAASNRHKMQKADHEWETIQAKIQKIQNKLSNAEERAKSISYDRMVRGAQSARNVYAVKSVAETMEAELRQNRESKYICKTRKITKYKGLKSVQLEERSEKNHKELEERKKRHTNGYHRKVEEKKERQEMYAQILEQKQLRRRNIFAMRSINEDDRLYMEGIKEISKELREENRKRQQRAMENKRQKVMRDYVSLTERNIDTREAYNLYQCHVRTQSIMDRNEKEETIKLLMQLKKNDPLKKDQRIKLLESIKALNEQMKIGAKLEYPKHDKSHMSVPLSPR